MLRNTWQTGTLLYVDGTDVYVSADSESQTADFIWQDEWIEATPKYHGGSAGDYLEWLREMFEPFYIQFQRSLFEWRSTNDLKWSGRYIPLIQSKARYSF